MQPLFALTVLAFSVSWVGAASAIGAVATAVGWGAATASLALWWARHSVAAPTSADAVRASVRFWRDEVGARWPRLGRRALYLALAGYAVMVFADALQTPPDWQIGDWGILRAVYVKIARAAPTLELPVWNGVVSTGDAPFETYPGLTYWVVAHFAWLTGLQDDPAKALWLFAFCVHLGTAITLTRLSARLLPWWAAGLVGVILVTDIGALSAGGLLGLFRWGLLHSSLALLLGFTGLVALIDYLGLPRTTHRVRLWCWWALASATHPAGLLFAGVVLIGLVTSALSTRPVRRGCGGALHVGVGVALGALVWMPYGARLLAYGQHFALSLRDLPAVVDAALAGNFVAVSFAWVGVVGLAAVGPALFSRERRWALLAVVTVVACMAMSDRIYLAFGLAPSPALARLGAERFAAVARPLVVMFALLSVTRVARWGALRWAALPRGQQLMRAWLGGVLLWLVAPGLAQVFDAHLSTARATVAPWAPAPLARGELTDWARQAHATTPPGQMARALIDFGDEHYQFHLVAETGLPVSQRPPIPDLMLRNRLDEFSPAALRHFNVRWVVQWAHAEPLVEELGAPLFFGPFAVRTFLPWEGEMVRVRAPLDRDPRVVTQRIADEAIDIEVTGGTALVSVAMGYYPRWRAVRSDGAIVPAEPLPAYANALVDTLGFRLSPGRWRLAPNGALPSDRAGWPLAAVAILVILSYALSAGWPQGARRLARWYVARHRTLRAMLARAIAPGEGRNKTMMAVVAGGALALLLAVLGYRSGQRPVDAVAVTTGAAQRATVAYQLGGDGWHNCTWRTVARRYDCDDFAQVYDTLTALLRDDDGSWPLVAPAITVVPRVAGVRIRVQAHRHLAGNYWLGATAVGGSVQIADETLTLGSQQAIAIADAAYGITLVSPVLGTHAWHVTMVRAETLAPSPNAVRRFPARVLSAPGRTLPPTDD